jgi:hypothetical protein
VIGANFPPSLVPLYSWVGLHTFFKNLAESLEASRPHRLHRPHRGSKATRALMRKRIRARPTRGQAFQASQGQGPTPKGVPSDGQGPCPCEAWEARAFRRTGRGPRPRAFRRTGGSIAFYPTQLGLFFCGRLTSQSILSQLSIIGTALALFSVPVCKNKICPEEEARISRGMRSHAALLKNGVFLP